MRPVTQSVALSRSFSNTGVRERPAGLQPVTTREAPVLELRIDSQPRDTRPTTPAKQLQRRRSTPALLRPETSSGLPSLRRVSVAKLGSPGSSVSSGSAISPGSAASPASAVSHDSPEGLSRSAPAVLLSAASAAAAADSLSGSGVVAVRQLRWGHPRASSASNVSCMVLMPNARVALGCGSYVDIWCRKEGRRARLKGHEAPVECLATAATFLASGSRDKCVQLWSDSEPYALIRTLGHDGPVHGLVDLDSKLMASCSGDSLIRVWDIVNGTCLAEHKACSSIMAAQLLPGAAARLAVGCANGVIEDWLNLHNVADPPHEVYRDRWRPYGFVSCRMHGHLAAVRALGVAVSSGRHLISGSDDHTVRIWTLQGKCIYTIDVPSPVLDCCNMRRTFVAVACGTSVIVFDMASRSLMDSVTEVRVSANAVLGQMSWATLLVGSSKGVSVFKEDQLLAKWDLSSGMAENS